MGHIGPRTHDGQHRGTTAVDERGDSAINQPSGPISSAAKPAVTPTTIPGSQPRRIGLIPKKVTASTDPHDIFLGLLQPDQMHEAHVNLIRHGRLVCHARNPAHEQCPVRDRCRFVDPKAP